MSRFTSSAARARIATGLLAVASSLAALVAVEVGFRALDMRGYYEARTRPWGHALLPGPQHVEGVSIQFRPHTSFTFSYDSNPRGYFDEGNGLTYHTNNYGFRGEEFSLEKPEAAFRIMVLGDSFTFGEGVKVEDLFTVRLQEILRAEATPSVEVLNFGTSAWSTSDEISYLEHAGLDFQPDLVVVVFVLNDAGAEVLDLWNQFRGSYEAPYPLRLSYAASFFYARFRQQGAGRRYVDTMVGSALQAEEQWQEALSYLPRGKTLAESIGAEFAVVVFPFMYALSDAYPFRALHGLVADVCRTASIECLDLLPAFEGQSYTDLWVHPSDQHPNEKAHAIAARAMADFLVERRLVGTEASR